MVRERSCSATSAVLTGECNRLEPDLYRTIVYAPSAITGMPAIRTDSELGWLLKHRRSSFRHTRNLLLCFQVSEHTLDLVVDACSALEDLKLYWRRFEGPPVHSTISRLTCSVWGPLYGVSPQLCEWPCMTTLTHVCIDFPDKLIGEVTRWLGALPRLTHLALRTPETRRLRARWLEALPRLRCLVFLRLGCTARRSAVQNDDDCDPRIVTSTVGCWDDRGHDWQLGHARGNDLWRRADDMIAARANGENPGEPPCLVDWDALKVASAEWQEYC
jgi:hypothetical protein